MVFIEIYTGLYKFQLKKDVTFTLELSFPGLWKRERWFVNSVMNKLSPNNRERFRVNSENKYYKVYTNFNWFLIHVFVLLFSGPFTY